MSPDEALFGGTSSAFSFFEVPVDVSGFDSDSVVSNGFGSSAASGLCVVSDVPVVWTVVCEAEA